MDFRERDKTDFFALRDIMLEHEIVDLNPSLTFGVNAMGIKFSIYIPPIDDPDSSLFYKEESFKFNRFYREEYFKLKVNYQNIYRIFLDQCLKYYKLRNIGEHAAEY